MFVSFDKGVEFCKFDGNFVRNAREV